MHVILVLNKADLFAEKLKRVPLSNYLPGAGEELDQAKQALQEYFEGANRDNRRIYCHFSDGASVENVMIVFNAVKDIIIRQSLEDAGLG